MATGFAKGARVDHVTILGVMLRGTIASEVNLEGQVQVRWDGQPESSRTGWYGLDHLTPVDEAAERLATARAAYLEWLARLGERRVATNRFPDEVHPHPKGRWVVFTVPTPSGLNWVARDPRGMGSMVFASYEAWLTESKNLLRLDYDRYLEEIWRTGS